MNQTLADVERRLRGKGLFGEGPCSISLRLPGEGTMVFQRAADASQTSSTENPGETDEAIHARVYRTRPDVGAVLLGVTPWTSAVATVGVPVPSLFDEQARHIGPATRLVSVGDASALDAALATGGNAVLIGAARLCLGSTPNRVVLNADLFEKCAKAFVLAVSTGKRVTTLPDWATSRWYERLRRDQTRAANAYAEGRVPEGMDAY